jgi:hypothetical protein
MANKQTELARNGDFSAILSYNDAGLPGSINIKRTKGHDVTLLSYDLDAVDGMGLCDATSLLQLPLDERGYAVKCLVRALEEEQGYGGKNLISVPPELIHLFEKGDFKTSPKTPNGKPFGMLMAANVIEVIEKLGTSEPIEDMGRFKVVTDKQQLHAMAADISELLITNAHYARGDHDEKRPLYSPEGIHARLAPDNVCAAVIVDTETSKPVASIRGYVKPGLGTYVSDFVVDENAPKTVARMLLRSALSEVQEKGETGKLFLLGGGKTAEFYKSIGFTSLTDNPPATLWLDDDTTAISHLTLENGNVAMLRLVPQQAILKEMPDLLSDLAEKRAEGHIPEDYRHTAQKYFRNER